MNRALMQAQYTLFMLMFFLLFIVVSFALIPIAWIVGIYDKQKAQTPQTPLVQKITNFGIFIPFGIPILIFDSFVDIVYFWRNNFRTDL